MTSYDQEKYQQVIILEICLFSEKEQAHKLAAHFSDIPNEYEPLQKDDINIQPIEKADIPQFKEVQVWMILSQLSTNKSTVPGDIPARIFKELAAQISEPLTPVFNANLLQGEYPKIYIFEVSTPVPKKASS